jgi:hypothetical protein
MQVMEAKTFWGHGGLRRTESAKPRSAKARSLIIARRFASSDEDFDNSQRSGARTTRRVLEGGKNGVSSHRPSIYLMRD